jgi:hypothetical protein
MQYATVASPSIPAHSSSTITYLDECQHWAARAIKAEALLAAQAVHREEVRTLGHHQETTRQVQEKYEYFFIVHSTH